MRTMSLVPRPLAAERSPWLRGTLNVPGDLTIAHLAMLMAALARGESIVTNVPDIPDIAALAEALTALGAYVERRGTDWHIRGLGAGGLLEPLAALDFGGSALGLELTLGLVGTYDFPVRVTADPELSAHAFTPLLDGLRRFGAAIVADDRGRPPIALRGPKLALPIAHDLPRSAPATKAALLLAALNTPGRSTFTESVPGWDHAERMLAAFGAEVVVTAGPASGRTIEIRGLPALEARQVVTPGDASFGALGAVAGSVVPSAELRIESVLVNPARTAVLSALVAMGATIEVRNLRTIGGEQVADLAVRNAPLRGIALAERFVGPLIADLPALAIAAAFADGQTVLHLPADLGYEDRGRIAALTRGLSANGIGAEAGEDALVIYGAGGNPVPGGGTIAAAHDPGLAMAFLVLGMATEDKVTIDESTGIEERFPGFVEAFENVGASFIHHAE